MTGQDKLTMFNKIYNETYDDILNYIIINSFNINDANDIIQDTYLVLWKKINNGMLEDINIKNYIIGIAIKKIRKHYSIWDKIKTISLFSKDNNDTYLMEKTTDNINLEDIVIKNNEWKMVWKYLMNKKNGDIPKVFFLYYKREYSIKEIAKLLNKTESYVKNLIYRTLKELQDKFGRDDIDE